MEDEMDGMGKLQVLNSYNLSRIWHGARYGHGYDGRVRPRRYDGHGRLADDGRV